MKSKRRVGIRLLAFLMVLMVSFGGVNVVPMMDPVAYVEAASKGTTIEVKKATTDVAKKIHKKIVDGTPVTLKVKGDKKSATSIVKSLQKKIQKVNKQGILFQYTTGKKSGIRFLMMEKNILGNTHMIIQLMMSIPLKNFAN